MPHRRGEPRPGDERRSGRRATVVACRGLCAVIANGTTKPCIAGTLALPESALVWTRTVLSISGRFDHSFAVVEPEK